MAGGAEEQTPLTSSAVIFSPRLVIMCCSSDAEMAPLPSLSKTLNACGVEGGVCEKEEE